MGATREKWLPIHGWPAYEVSDHGRVRSFNKTGTTSYPECRAAKARILRLSLCRTAKYPRVTLSAGGFREKIRVHKLVTDAFLGARPDHLEVRHIDGDRNNNRLSNLEYGTHKKNGEDMVRHGHTRRTLSVYDCKQIRKQYAAGWLQQELADEFAVGQTTISRVTREHGCKR